NLVTLPLVTGERVRLHRCQTRPPVGRALARPPKKWLIPLGPLPSRPPGVRPSGSRRNLDLRPVEQPGRYGPPEVVHASRIARTPGVERFEKCAGRVERHNLTLRTFLRRFTRLALGFSKKLENLAAATALYLAHYNYCRRHGTLRMAPARKDRLTG